MYKYSVKEENLIKEVKDDHIAEVTGLYCDLCGKLILKRDKIDSTYPRPIADYTRRRISREVDNRPRKVGDVIPVMRLHSFANDVIIDICCDCETDILSKIQKHAPSIIDRLTSTTSDVIVNTEEDINNLKEERNRLRDRLDDMRSVLDQNHDC